MKILCSMCVLAGWLSLAPAFAQESLLEKEVVLPERASFGPNGKYFSHFYGGVGLVAGKPEFGGADIRYGYSRNFEIGKRYKFKWSEYWSAGFDLYYKRLIFDLVQENEKVFPTNRVEEKEQLVLRQLGTTLFIRLNFKPRGDYMGTFLDLGGFGSFAVDRRFLAWQTSPDPAYQALNSKVVYNRLEYLHPYLYGLSARLGFNRYVLTGSFRLSDLFRDNYPEYPELPRWSLGVQVGIH